MTGTIAVDKLSEAEASRGAGTAGRSAGPGQYGLSRTQDAPEISDAEYDALKARNTAIRSALSASQNEMIAPANRWAAPRHDGFAKLTHAVRMLSLSNAFDDGDISDFDDRDPAAIWACRRMRV